MQSKTALFPGSFDPITKGHEDVVRRALPLFDKIIIGVGTNSLKNYAFDLNRRIQMIKETFADVKQVEVETYEGLTVNFCKQRKVGTILRGLRNSTDFQYEKNIAQMNRSLAPEIDTIFIITAPELAAISSTIVRDIHKHGGDIRQFVPQTVKW